MVVIVVVALLIFGPGKIPEIARAISRAYREFAKVRRQVDDTLTDLREEIDLKLEGEESAAPQLRKPAGTRVAARGEPDAESFRSLDQQGSAGQDSSTLEVPEEDDYLAGRGQDKESPATDAGQGEEEARRQ